MIYVVEDDKGIRELELYTLRNAGFEARGFVSGGELCAACEQELPELVLLDVMLPGEDGLSVLKDLRSRGNTRRVPVIMVTAKSSELDRVKGLDGGADDYIVKPFGVMELASRVRSLLRRACSNDGAGELRFGDIVLDDRRRLVTAGGEPCALTFKEYELLKLLLANAGLVLSRDRLMDEVWGYGYRGESRTVDAHIKTLRQKLGGSGWVIKTVRNVGYKLEK